MDEDEIFPELCLMNTKKTYSKPFRKLLRTSSTANNVKQIIKPLEKDVDLGKPLTTKVALEYLLSGKLKTEVCRYCLKIVPGLSELDQVMQIAGTGALYKVTIRQMIACFYPYRANEDQNFPEKICQKCLDKAISAYLFMQQCEQAERALLNCLDDMYERLDKLDPIDRPKKKRGRQKLNPNYNVLYAEHIKVMDYAEPIRNIINVKSESLTREPNWNKLECKKCWQVLPDLDSLLNHEKIHPKSMWYHCRLCGKSFVKLIQLRKHYNRVHVLGKKSGLEADKNFTCKECGNVTENYVQHLQHIEKHKFKTIMKHIIEKKTDRLCMICLSDSNELVELDKMICIHGGYPELMGDTSMYKVLAATLPNPKSYKYQELHVPHQSNIMTITKRKRKGENIESVVNIDKKKVKYVLSLPIVVSKDRFKTDDFYYYVFCEPQTDIENAINYDMGTESSKIVKITDIKPNECNNDQDEAKPDDNNTIEVFGNSDLGDNKLGDNKSFVNVNDNTHLNQEIMMTDDNTSADFVKNSPSNNPSLNNVNIKTDLLGIANLESKNKSTIDLIETDPVANSLNNNNKEVRDSISLSDTLEETCNMEDDIIYLEPTDLKHNPYKEDKTIKPSFEKGKTNTACFSNPIILEESNTDAKLDGDIAYVFNFSPLANKTNIQEVHEVKPIIESIHSEGDQEKSDSKWVFSKTLEKSDVVGLNEDKNQIRINKDNCKYCWVFKYLVKCEHCRKPNVKASNTAENTVHNQYKNIHDNFSNNNIQIRTEGDTSIKATKKSIRIKKIEIDNIWQCNVCLTNNTDRFSCYCCESKKYIENANCKVIYGKNKAFFDATLKQETDKTQIDKDIFNVDKTIELFTNEPVPLLKYEEPSLDSKIINNQDSEKEITHIKDINTESVDVEMDTDNIDNQATENDEQMDFEENPCIPNIVQSFSMPPLSVPIINTLPYTMTNINFNIGSNSDGVTKKKTKRAFRNVSKTFHK